MTDLGPKLIRDLTHSDVASLIEKKRSEGERPEQLKPWQALLERLPLDNETTVSDVFTNEEVERIFNPE